MNMKLLLEKKEAAYKNFQKIKNLMESGEKVDRNTIVNAMQRCNDCDQAILDYEKSFTQFLKERENNLVDCDKSCGNEDADARHLELRKQYQQIFGKDIKHG